MSVFKQSIFYCKTLLHNVSGNNIYLLFIIIIIYNLFVIICIIYFSFQMQMRFDGLLGFPGGLVDKGEDPVTGLNREMLEEIGLDLEQYAFNDGEHAISFLHEKKKLILHFYIKEVSIEQFRGIEEKCCHAHEYGIEVSF